MISCEIKAVSKLFLTSISPFYFLEPPSFRCLSLLNSTSDPSIISELTLKAQPAMATQISNPAYGQWEMQKSTIEQVHVSRHSTESYDSTAQRVRIRPNVTELRASHLDAEQTKVFLHREYLSSEETLSSGEPDVEISDYEQLMDEYEDDDDLDEQIIQAVRKSVVEIAISVSIRVAGRPSIVDIPPSPTKVVPVVPFRQRPPMYSEKKGLVLQTNFSGTPVSRAWTPSSRESLPVRPYTTFSNYQCDDSPSSDISSARGSPPSNTNPLALKQPHQAEFIFADPLAADRESSMVSFQDMLDEPLSAPPEACTFKARPGSFKMLSTRISDRSKRAAVIELSPKPSWQALTSTPPTATAPPRKFPKREARGASERSPTIVIPPCPYDPADPWFKPMPSDNNVLRKPMPRRIRATSLQPMQVPKGQKSMFF